MFEAFISRANHSRGSRTLTSTTVAALSVVVLSAVAVAPSSASAQPSGVQSTSLESTYSIDLGEVDGSGVTGAATILTSSAGLRLQLDAQGTSAGREHPVALHRSADEASRCPRPTDDRDDDGFVTGDELSRVAGPIGFMVGSTGSASPDDAAVLGSSDRADGAGRLVIDRALETPAIETAEIGSLRLIVYGNDVNFSNRYERASATRPAEATIAVACGEVTLETIEIPAPFTGASGTSGIVTRLYVSILQRSPEPLGHEYFSSEIDGGASSIDVVWAMAGSPEFTQRFGAKLDAPTSEWVDFVYRSIFGRRADTPGRQYWVSQLDRGLLEREAMLFYFADSAEFKTTTATS